MDEVEFKRAKKRKIAWTWGLTASAICLTFLVQFLSGGDIRATLMVALLMTFPAIALSLVFWGRQPQEEKETPVVIPKSEAELQAEAEAARKQAELEDKWWFRYPLGLLILGAAWYLWESKPNLWWLSALFVLGAIGQMRELACLLTALILIWLLVASVSSVTLSVPVAIILGAGIIAYAIHTRK